MKLICLDCESYYDQEYSLSKITTEEYIRDTRFEVIGVSVQVDDQRPQWFSGTHAETKKFLAQFDWARSALLAHNTMFDAAILAWRFDIHPKILFDTLSMERAIHGPDAPVSLAALAERYKIGRKGDEVTRAKGKRRADFTPAELAEYGRYCVNDVTLTHDLFKCMLPGFPRDELKLIDVTLRMFTQPTLLLDTPRLTEHLTNVALSKDRLLAEAGIEKAELMSNEKFAEALRTLGVDPPMKISPRTGKMAYALAKSDDAMKELAEHEDLRVQTLVAARLGTKSTLEETRTERFIGISRRGPMPVPLRYCAAISHRWGGQDKINLQNLPSRGPNAKKLKQCIMAPQGMTLLDSDSSQIEARVLAWMAEQDDLVETFRQNNREMAAGVPKKLFAHDPYKRMASAIYGVPVEDITGDMRQGGKVVLLGCGYGLGADRFVTHAKQQGMQNVDLPEAQRIIRVYRETNYKIPELWKSGQTALKALLYGQSFTLGVGGLVDVRGSGMLLPSGLWINYPDLQLVNSTDRQGKPNKAFTYAGRRGARVFIHGAKLIENLIQALARDIVGWQILQIAKRYRVVLTVHDSVVCCVRTGEREEAAAYVTECMQRAPDWAEGLPVNCELHHGERYGDYE